MADVKALFPVGKTQWRKWRPEQQTAFNEACASGMAPAEAIRHVNRLELVEVSIAPPAPPPPASPLPSASPKRAPAKKKGK